MVQCKKNNANQQNAGARKDRPGQSAPHWWNPVPLERRFATRIRRHWRFDFLGNNDRFNGRFRAAVRTLAMFLRIVNSAATATDTTCHGDAVGLDDGGACCCCCRCRCSSGEVATALGCAAGFENGMMRCHASSILDAEGAPEAVGGGVGGGAAPFDNLLHSASRSAWVASLNSSFPSGFTVKVPTSVQNRAALSVTSGKFNLQVSLIAMLFTVVAGGAVKAVKGSLACGILTYNL